MTAIRAGVRIGPVDQIPVGEGRAFAVHGEQVAVFRLRDGRVHALGAVCPHRGGPIADGQIDGAVVLCPLHLNAFEFATGCSRTSEHRLPLYRAEIHDGEVVVVGPVTEELADGTTEPRTTSSDPVPNGDQK